MKGKTKLCAQRVRSRVEVTKGVAGRAGLEYTELTYGLIDSCSYYLKMYFVEDCSQIMMSGAHFPHTPECCSAHWGDPEVLS